MASKNTAAAIFGERGRGTDLSVGATIALRECIGECLDSEEQAALWLLIAAGREVLRKEGAEFERGGAVTVADELDQLFEVDARSDDGQERLLRIARDIAAEIL